MQPQTIVYRSGEHKRVLVPEGFLGQSLPEMDCRKTAICPKGASKARRKLPHPNIDAKRTDRIGVSERIGIPRCVNGFFAAFEADG